MDFSIRPDKSVNTKIMLERAKSVIQARTKFIFNVQDNYALCHGARIYVVNGYYTTPFTAPFPVREILKELNEDI